MIDCEQRPFSFCLMFKHRRHLLCVQSARTAAAALIPLHLFCFAPLISPRFLHPPSKCLFVHVSFMTGAPWLSNHFFLAAGGSDRALEQKRVVWHGAFTCHEESIKSVRKTQECFNSWMPLLLLWRDWLVANYVIGRVCCTLAVIILSGEGKERAELRGVRKQKWPSVPFSC